MASADLYMHYILYLCIYLDCFEVGSHMEASLASNSLCSSGWPEICVNPSCLSLLYAEFIGVSHHTQLFIWQYPPS